MADFKSITQFLEQIKQLQAAGFVMPATIMVFIGIDLMAYLSLPLGDTRQTRAHYREWVDGYMKAVPEQPYQYDGMDLYAARTSVLHVYGSEADIHNITPAPKKFAYTNGGKHMYRAEVDANLVLIGTASFIDDFVRAVEEFMKAAIADEDLQKRIGSRINGVFAHIPI